MSKAKKVIAAAVMFLAVAAIVITVIITSKLNKPSAPDTSEIVVAGNINNASKSDAYKKSGVISENGSDILHIHDYAYDNNYGGSGYNFLENDDIVSIEYLGGCGWNLIPKKSGHCGIAVDKYWVDYLGTDIYDITVDENFKISYTARDTWKYPLYNHSIGKVTVQNGDNTVVFSDTDESNLLKELNALYGGSEYPDTAPDFSNCVKIICVCAYDEYSYDLYVSNDRIYYFNENMEIWEEFTPDEFCSLDRINELLDLKD